MNIMTASRIVADRLFQQGIRKNYWATSQMVVRMTNLLSSSNRTFAYHVIKDYARFLLGTVRPIHGQTRERARAAVDWILRAQDATADSGVSYGYFPCDEEHGWIASYPETTGYLIPSLLEFARRFGDDEIHQRALRMAYWEVEIQMESGAVQGGHVCPPEKQTPAVFNTGMVLDGWSAAYRASGDEFFLEAGRRAADFLLGDLDENGYFKTNGQFVSSGQIKTYNCLCAWSMYRYGDDVQETRYQQAAHKIVEAALRQQQPNGWFANNCLGRPKAPLLHTIGYTLQGILEVGILAGREEFVAAVKLGTDPLISRMSRMGFLYGRFYADWEPAVFSSCLTGSAQLAVVCYRLYAHLGESKYLAAADCIVNYLKALQALDSENESINGALAGSFPLFGGYMTAGYPNWATKYFLDSLLLQEHFLDNSIRPDSLQEAWSYSRAVAHNAFAH
jgi:hypothetical protein